MNIARAGDYLKRFYQHDCRTETVAELVLVAQSLINQQRSHFAASIQNRVDAV